jgi:hypothetical protein
LQSTGAIEGLSGVAANLTVPVAATSGSLASNSAIVVNGAAPYVTSVSSSTANGTYKAGDAVSVTVTFNTAVDVTGSPRITLETGVTDAVVNYTSGTGTTTLTFNYTVAGGHTSSDLDYASTTALALNGGTIIKNGASDAAILTLPTVGGASSIAGQKAIVIDTTAPTLTLTATNPATTGSTRMPNVIGTVNDAGATMTLYSDSACTSAISSGASQVTLQGTGIPITTNLTADATSIIYSRAADAAGNLTACNAAGTTISYTHDGTSPTITVVSIVTASPGRSLTPQTQFTLSETSTVTLYSDSGCSTTAISSATSLNAGVRNLTINAMTADSSITIYGKGIDGVGNASGCVTIGLYVNDRTSPGDAGSFTPTAGDTQIAFTWTAASGSPAGYIVLRKTSAVTDVPTAGSSYAVSNTIGTSTVIYAGTGTSFTDSGLTNGTTYHYKIFAYDTAYNYAAGVAASATPTGGGGPSDIDHIVFTDQNSLNVQYLSGTPGNAFTLETIDTVGGSDKIYTSAITLDASNKPRVGYYIQNPNSPWTGTHRYATRESGSWVNSGDLYTGVANPVPGLVHVPLDIAWGNAATPYLDFFYAYAGYSLKYLTLINSSWSAVVQLFSNVSTTALAMPAIAVDNTFTTHLLAQRYTGSGPFYYNIEYYTRSSGTGSWTSVASTRNYSGGTCDHARNPNVALAAGSTNPDVVYFCSITYIVHARHNVGWTYEDVVTTGLPSAIPNEEYIAFAISGAGDLHIAFTNAVGDLLYMKKPFGGSWSTTTVQPYVAGQENKNPQIGITSGGNARLYYVVAAMNVSEIRVAYTEAGMTSPVTIHSVNVTNVIRLGKNVGINGVNGNSHR